VEEWQKKEPYKFDPTGNIYSIDTPPPYVNTSVHIGQAITYCYMDFFARFKRMMGFSVLFPLGLDRNGLPIELAAEQRFKIRAEDTGREKFLKYCEKILEEASDISVKTFSRLGISFTSYKFGNKIGEAYHTDSEDYRKLTQETFIDLWNRGLIYESEKVSNYCPGCRTTIADAEIIYRERDTELVHIKFKTEAGKDIVVATTRPELLCSCAEILFNPSDKRYKDLNRKHAFTPIYEKEVVIKAHPIAKKEFGTGLVMMCSFGDLTDIRFFREEGIKPIIAINESGAMNKNAGFLQGLSVREARRKIIEKLKEKGLVVKIEKIKQRSPICERSKHEIEFISLKEFYLKQLEFKDKIRNIADKINFYDESSRQILLNWIDALSEDWPLSRRRYYATPIPLWRC
ncbi:MAG: class I tRNA ligase family protein, partial [Nanoarchaeota archaeon]